MIRFLLLWLVISAGTYGTLFVADNVEGFWRSLWVSIILATVAVFYRALYDTE